MPFVTQKLVKPLTLRESMILKFILVYFCGFSKCASSDLARLSKFSAFASLISFLGIFVQKPKCVMIGLQLVGRAREKKHKEDPATVPQVLYFVAQNAHETRQRSSVK